MPSGDMLIYFFSTTNKIPVMLVSRNYIWENVVLLMLITTYLGRVELPLSSGERSMSPWSVSQAHVPCGVIHTGADWLTTLGKTRVRRNRNEWVDMVLQQVVTLMSDNVSQAFV